MSLAPGTINHSDTTKGRESGMSDGWEWEEFFAPAKEIEFLGCGSLPGDVVEFGCGYRTFALPAAPSHHGTVDIDPEMWPALLGLSPIPWGISTGY